MRDLIRPVLVAASLATSPLLLACADDQPKADAPGEAMQSTQQKTPVSQDSTALARAEFDVAGMDCGGCVIGTRAALRKIDGVTQAGATYEEATGEGTAWAVYDPAKVRPERLMEAIRELGYTPVIREG